MAEKIPNKSSGFLLTNSGIWCIILVRMQTNVRIGTDLRRHRLNCAKDREMKEKKLFMASCPVCGRGLFKGAADSYVESGCPKCKSFLKIQFTASGFEAHVTENISHSPAAEEKK